MSARADLSGKKYGRLTVLRPGRLFRKRLWWVVRCECGTEKEVRAEVLKRGNTVSCGCYRRRMAAEFAANARGKRTGPCSIPSNPTRRATRACWGAMLARCYREKHPAYRHYGGAGVFVCARWREDFDAFVADMGHRPSNRHSIDRFPDKAGNYEPGNCRWATSIEQNSNRKNNRLLTIDGETRTMSAWATVRCLGVSTVRARLLRGDPPAEALRPLKRKRAPRRTDEIFVYFAQRSDGLIKIGMTNKPHARRRQLRDLFGRLSFLAWADADVTTEAFLHATFGADRVEGEWFRTSLRLRELIESVQDNDRIPAEYLLTERSKAS